MIQNVLWSTQNKKTLLAATCGAALGILLLLLATQTYFNLAHILNGNANTNQNYLTINKKVGMLNTLLGSDGFSNTEITELQQQPFIQQVAPYTSNKYKVAAKSSTLNFYTELFLEALPTDVLDLAPNRWQWTEGNAEVPIIMSRNYLALYNFGFAPSQGLPQFSPNSIRQVSFDLILRGNQREYIAQGRIIGFSDRINSILVPASFMQWANQNFGEPIPTSTNRLLLRVSNIYDKNLTSYLQNKGYEISEGKMIGSELSSLLRTTFAIIAIIALFIIILAALLFTLHFQVLVTKATPNIQLLFQIGYPVTTITSPFTRLFLHHFAVAATAALLLLVLAQYAATHWLTTQGYQLPPYPSPYTITLAAILFTIILFSNIQKIKTNIQKIAPL
jgi:hypothetical protein